MNYTDYVSTMQTMLGMTDTTGQTNLTAILPRMIEFAELKILRDLDLVTASATTPFTYGAAAKNQTVNGFVIVTAMAIYTPFGTTSANGKRNELRPVDLEFLNMICPDFTAAPAAGQIPRYFATFNDNVFAVGPVPDQAYAGEAYGVVRPTPLSSGNPTTFISANLPDLLVSASMIFGSGYKMNFGAQADNPQMALSWQAVYDKQKEGANVEEARKKAQAWEWTAQGASPLADQRR